MSIVLQIATEKERILSKIRSEVEDCVRCTQLCSTRNQTVFGVGNHLTRVMFVGEAPGREEDKQGKPFVGKAGQLLDNILKSSGWSRDDIYIANVVKCRPPQNRVPEQKEITNCFGYLERQIEVVNPEYIVCLGSVASTAIVGKSITVARGSISGILRYKHHKVLCTYHPAYLLRNPKAKEYVASDLRILFKDMRDNVAQNICS